MSEKNPPDTSWVVFNFTTMVSATAAATKTGCSAKAEATYGACWREYLADGSLELRRVVLADLPAHEQAKVQRSLAPHQVEHRSAETGATWTPGQRGPVPNWVKEQRARE